MQLPLLHPVAAVIYNPAAASCLCRSSTLARLQSVSFLLLRDAHWSHNAETGWSLFRGELSKLDLLEDQIPELDCVLNGWKSM